MAGENRSELLGGRRFFGIFSILSAVLSLLLIAGQLSFTIPSSPAQILTYITNIQGPLLLLPVLVLLWMAFSVLFVVGLWSRLKSGDAAFAQVALVLSAGGLLLLGYGYYTGLASLVTIATTTGAPTGVAAYLIAVAVNNVYLMTDPGLISWGMGQLIFGWLAWKSGRMPNWLGILGSVGGCCGILESLFPPAVAPILTVAGFGIFAIWGLSVGIQLLMRK